MRSRRPAPAAPRVARGAAQGDRARRPARAGGVRAVVAGRRPPRGGGRRPRPPARGARPAAGAGAARRRVGARRPPAPHGRVLADVARRAVRVRRGRLGRRGRPRAQLRQGRAVLPRGRGGDRHRRRPRAIDAPGEPAHDLLRERLGRSPCFFTDLLAEVSPRARGPPGGALGPRLGGRGHQRRVGAAARPAPDAGPRAARDARAPRPRRAGGSAPGAAARSRRCRDAGR